MRVQPDSPGKALEAKMKSSRYVRRTGRGIQLSALTKLRRRPTDTYLGGYAVNQAHAVPAAGPLVCKRLLLPAD
jgi:hypothetical protein